MATKVASLFATLTLDDQQFMRSLGQASGGLGGIGTKITSLGDQMTTLGVGINQMIDPLVGFGLEGIAVAGNFQEAMTEIAARTRLSEEAMEGVAAAATDMGAISVFSAQQVSEAMLDLLTSGQTVGEMLATLPHVIDATTASGGELGATADTLTDIMAAFGLGVESAESVVNSLASAAASSSADIASLGQGFANVGPIARQMGLSVDETSAALAILAENGIKGSESGTALKSMLNGITANTASTQGAWAELNLSMFDAQGNVRDINDVLGDLTGAFAQLPMADQIRLAQDLAGSYGKTALLALTSGQSIGEMQEMMAGQATAAEIADARMGTFNVTMDSLGGSVEALQTTVFLPFIENVLQPFAEKGILVVNMLTDWAAQNPETVATIVAVTEAVAALATGLIVVGTAISGLGIVIGVATSPVTIFIAAVVLLVIGLNELSKALGMGTIFEVFEEGISSGAEIVRLSLEIIEGAFRVTFNFIEGLFNSLVGWIANIDLGVLEDVANITGDILGGIAGAAGDVVGLLPGFAEGGDTPAGQPLRVGERGPETFIPATAGTIVSNEAGGGAGGGVQITGPITIHANDEAGGRAAAFGFADQLDTLLMRNG